MRKRELESRIKRLKKLKTQQQELTTSIEVLENEVKAELERKQLNKFQVGVFTVCYSNVSRNKLDTSAFKEKYSDLSNQFVKSISYKRLTIS